MSIQKIKKGDLVMVRSGKDKGKTGVILRVSPKIEKAVVEGLNLAKKCVKANPQRDQAGGFVSKELPMAWSKLGVLNPRTGKADRVGIRVLEDGRRVRFFKSDNELVDAK